MTTDQPGGAPPDQPTRPSAFDVVEASLGPDVRPVRLPDRTVVRTPTRPDDPSGNAVHLPRVVDEDEVPALLAAAADRFPTGTPRVLARRGAGRDAVGEPVDVVVLDQPVAAPAGWRRRDDLELRPPYDDDRAWHAMGVLRRHAVLEAPDGESPRGRGALDDLLGWQVAGRRTMVGLGRARAVLADRFRPFGSARWDGAALLQLSLLLFPSEKIKSFWV